MTEKERDFILDLIENGFHLDNEKLQLLRNDLERLKKYDDALGYIKEPCGRMTKLDSYDKCHYNGKYDITNWSDMDIYDTLGKLEDIYENK
jgi:hypothetical protein